MGKPAIYDINLLLQAGIDPKTGKPIRAVGEGLALKSEIKRMLRIIDEQDAVNRYKWYNIPCDLTSEEIERMLYYKGQLAFFKVKYNGEDKFFLTPYALSGTIDFYGRFNFIHPVAWASGMDTDLEKKNEKFDAIAALLSTLNLKVVKAPIALEDLTLEDFDNSAVLLHDYCKQLSQTIIPRREINERLLDIEADCFPLLKLALLNNTGIRGMKVPDADSSSEAQRVAVGMLGAALRCEPFIPITSKLDFQDLGDKGAGKAEEFLLTLQALDNIRLGTYGIDNGGIFQKKAHILEKEASMAAADVQLALQDGLAYRQHFCNIVNSIWGLALWCEPAEAVVRVDQNGDGKTYNEDLGDEGGETIRSEAPETEITEGE